MTVQHIILNEIEARLKNISTLNGYSETVLKFERAKLKPFVSGDLPAINYWATPDAVVSRANGRELHELNVVVELHTMTRDRPFIDVAFEKGGDIVTSLFRSTGAPKVSDPKSIALGGLVSSIIINDTIPVIGEGQKPWCGVIIDATVQYNTHVGDVFNIINF